ncbi:hypothetical protein PybrP1_005878 [[Pythium] brassicae (nom. inval.)]|nr:hypothetical protein PybrP1_005878 [[Pythium] brassicae (nom. inval.)]
MRDEPSAALAATRDEDAFSPSRNLAYVELAKSQLPTLVAECARADSKLSSVAMGPSFDDSAEWKRLKFKKNCDVQVWEKGSVSAEGPTGDPGARRRKARGNGSRTPAPPRGDFTDTSEFAAAAAPPLLTYAVRSAVRVPAPLDVVLRTLDCSAVTTYRSFTKIIYESLVADTSVLYHSQSLASLSGGVASESLAVRWMVCRCNNPMVSDCDLCFLEYSKVHSVDDPAPAAVDGQALFRFRPNNHSSSSSGGGGGGDDSGSASGGGSRSREGLHDRHEFPSAYKILCSIETKSCPELFDSHRLARCFMPLGGFLFYPTDTVDATDVLFYMSVAQQDPHAVSISDRQFRAVQRVLQRMARGAGRIKNAVDAYTMSLRLEMLRNTRWVRNTERAECVVCYRRFHQLTRRRHHCRLCGDVICRDCSVYKDADLPTIGPTVLRVCKLCDLNELKGSVGSTAAAAASAPATPTVSAAKPSAGNNNNDDDDFELKGPARQAPAPEIGKKLTRKRSTTLNVDTSKATVHEQQHEPEIGRRFTTVVDGKDRRELPEQAFSCSKADIAGRQYKWNTGGGGKPLVILSPSSAALYATRTSSGKAAKAATPVGRTSMSVAPQDWHGPAHPAAPAPPQHTQGPYPSRAPELPQAKSCSKVSPSSFTPFDKFSFRGKAPGGRELHAAPSRQRGVSSVHDSDRREFDEDNEKPSRAAVHPSRVVKSGKLVVPGHDNRVDAIDGKATTKKKSRSTKAAAALKRQPAPSPSNQHREVPSSELVPRKLSHVDKYEDILLKLCEEIAKAMECKYAAVSLFTASASTSLQQPLLPGAPLPSSSGTGFAGLPAAHYLKADGSKKLAKVAANMMCCAPILELKEKLITRDALASCNMFDFKRLPIVIGPQQVRFYAGIPLLDANQHMVGALAVFDSGLYQGCSVNDVLPRMSAFASIALAAIEDRKTELEIKSFLENPLVDPKHGNQALRVSEPVFHIDMDLDSLSVDADEDDDDDDDDDSGDVDFRGRPRHHSHSSGSGGEELQLRQRFSAYPARLQRHPPPPAHDVEYYKNQMEQLVRQARETEAQMLENSMAMKRQGVAIW